MKKSVFIFGLALLIGAAAVLALNAGGRAPMKESFVAGEALVQFKPEVGSKEASELIAKAGASVKERIEPQRIYVVSFPSSISPQEMVQRFQQMPQVAIAEPNGIVEILAWDLFAPSEAWAEPGSGPLGAGSKVRVAVIDTAIDSNHSALQGKTVPGWSFVNSSANTQSAGAGQDWHGTASTGRILDGAGDANVEIMPVQVFGSSGGASWSTVINAVNYAVDNGAQVINMSLGGSGYSPLMQQAIDRAVAKGVIVVASSGNTYREQAFYPAALNGVISVAATNESGQKASFSTYHSTVDISAPGDTQRLLSHGGYTTARGTSFSAPFITGMVAMLKSAFPHLTAAQMEQTIKAKAQNVNEHNPKFAGKLGAGFLNALDVGKWMAEIRAGTFRFPWQVGAPPAPPVVQPPPAPVQPWLVRGKGHSGSYVVTPSGEVVKE